VGVAGLWLRESGDAAAQSARNDDPRGLTEYWEKERMVSAEQIKEGRRWAHEMFDQHFNGSQEGSDTTESRFCERG
jgi:hypothetical protein